MKSHSLELDNKEYKELMNYFSSFFHFTHKLSQTEEAIKSKILHNIKIPYNFVEKF